MWKTGGTELRLAGIWRKKKDYYVWKESETRLHGGLFVDILEGKVAAQRPKGRLSDNHLVGWLADGLCFGAWQRHSAARQGFKHRPVNHNKRGSSAGSTAVTFVHGRFLPPPHPSLPSCLNFDLLQPDHQVWSLQWLLSRASTRSSCVHTFCATRFCSHDRVEGSEFPKYKNKINNIKNII